MVVDFAVWSMRWLGFLAPVLGLVMFLMVSFKPAVTLYAAIATLGMALGRTLEEVRWRRELEATATRIARREVRGDTG